MPDTRHYTSTGPSANEFAPVDPQQYTSSGPSAEYESTSSRPSASAGSIFSILPPRRPGTPPPTTPPPTTPPPTTPPPSITPPPKTPPPTTPPPPVGDPGSISRKAQDIADAQGVAYKDVGKPEPLPDYTDYDSEAARRTIDRDVNIQRGSSFIDPDKSTVSGQLQSLLTSDSPYLSESRRGAQEAAGKRGLLNSSIAAGAGQRAAIQSALPIAQGDAEIYSKFGLQEQAAKNQMETIQGEAIVSGEIVKQQKALEQQNQNIQNRFTAMIRGADAQSQTWMADLKNTYDTHMNEFNAQQQLLLQREQISAEKNQMVRKETSAVMQNYQITVENLMTDPDFLAMGKDSVNKAVNELQALARNTINFIGAASEIDLTEFTKAYLGNLSVR